MIPDLPAELGPSELKALYLDADAANAARHGIALSDASEWPRYRKYAFSRFWEQRLRSGETLSEAEAFELKASLAWDFCHEVAQGLVGDAARMNVLSQEHVGTLIACVPPSSYADRQLRSRKQLTEAEKPSIEAIEALISLRAGWALCELVEKATDETSITLFDGYANDSRIIRANRHQLREAVRIQRKKLSNR